MRYLSIKNFDKHQHYKDRRPPWIKLHAEVLDDYDFLCLQDASKAHLMLLWVLASKLDNRIPYDLAFIAKKLGTTSPVDVEELVLQGFIEVSQDDSKPLARRKQSAMPETETETERERESKGASRKKRGEPAPWMGQVRDVIAKHYGAAGSKGKYWTEALRPLVAEHGIDAVVVELGAYCARTKLDYVSPPKFADLFGGWAQPVVGSIQPNPNAEAEHVWELCKRYGFHHCTRSTIDGELERAQLAGDIDDTEAFKATLRKLDVTFLREARSDGAAVASIAKRLAA